MVKSEAPNIPAETFKLSYQRRRQASASSSQYNHHPQQQYQRGSPPPPPPPPSPPPHHRQTEQPRPSTSLMSPSLRPQLPIMGIVRPGDPPYGFPMPAAPPHIAGVPIPRDTEETLVGFQNPRDTEERLAGYQQHRDTEERHVGYQHHRDTEERLAGYQHNRDTEERLVGYQHHRDTEERLAGYQQHRDTEERHVGYQHHRDTEERLVGYQNPGPLSSPASGTDEEEEAVDLSNNSLNRSQMEETENAVIYANLTRPDSIAEPSPMEEEQLQADTKLTLKCLEISALSQDPVRPFGESEKALVAMLISTEYEAAKSVEVNPEIAACFIDAAKNGAKVPYHILIEGHTTCMRRIVKFASALDIFNTFDHADQRQLLLNNTGMLVNIRTARFLKPDRDLKYQLKIMSDSANLDEEKPHTSQESAADSVRIRYKQIFQSPFACSEADEERFALLMERVFKLEMDRVTTGFMSLIALFSTTYAKIKEESLALERQEFFAKLLYRYLVDTIGMAKARELLPKYIHLLAELQEMAQIMITKCLKY